MREKEYTAVERAAGPVAEKNVRDLALEALSHYRRAQEYLKLGNWGSYGEELGKMDEILRKIEKKK
jgi:biotin synthase-related radical SAM superfamily protein